MHSSYPLRTPKSQLAAEQPMTGECWNPPKIPMSKGKGEPEQDGRRGAIAFNIKCRSHWRHLEGANKTLCTPGPRERSRDLHKRLSQTWFECLSVSCGGTVTCHRDRGSRCSRSGKCGVWPKSSWKRSPLAPL